MPCHKLWSAITPVIAFCLVRRLTLRRNFLFTEESHGKISVFIDVVILVSSALLYAVIVSLHWSEGYIDFGDGNYLYISSRLADGVVLYRDIMAPQPPLHLYLGCFLQKLARIFNLEPLFTVRSFSLILHLATFFLLYLLALRIFQRKETATLSAIIYLIIPVGFWWSLGYQSEPTMVFLLLLGIYFFLGTKPKELILSALFATFAIFTNMTSAPYVAFSAFYAIVRRKKIWLYYAIPLSAMITAGVVLAEGLTGAYLQNVIFDQVGTFPKKEISGESVVQYALRKIASEGRDVLIWEGGVIILAILGLFSFTRHSPHSLKEYIAWYGFFSFCSILFVSKGGTMDYIFTIAEPYVALFAAYFLVLFFEKTPALLTLRPAASLRDTTSLLRLILVIILLIINFGIGGGFIVATLKQRTYELPEEEVKKIKYYIQKYTNEGDAILAPPFYAFISGRKVVEEYSEIFIWTIKYWNERIVDKRDGEGVRKVEKISQAIKERRLQLIILDLSQTARVPEIRQAIDENYKPLLNEPFQTLNTRLQFYIPSNK